MKVLIILPSLANRGPILVAQQIVSGLRKLNIYCEVWYFDAIHELSFACPTRNISFFEKLNIDQFDLIHSHSFRPDAWVAKLRITGVKTHSITTIHNYVDIDLKYQYGTLVSCIFSPIWRYLWRFQTKVIVLSKDAHAYYRLSLPDEKIIVIGNGLSDHGAATLPKRDFNRIYNLKSKHFVLGACAQVTKRKGLEQIVDALVRHRDCAFVLVGDGPQLRQLQSQAESLGVSERCLFLGFRPNARDFVPHFDAVTLPSRSEGFPLSFIEAASAARPVLLSDIPIFQEIVPRGAASFFRLDDPSSLSEAIYELRRRQTDLGAAVRTLYEENFSVDAMADKYVDCYRQLSISKPDTSS